MSPTLTILIPVFNEEHTLPTLMREVSTTCPDAQIIYIDDGSRDSSLAILNAQKRTQDIVLSSSHSGKGAAIRHGLVKADGTYTIIQDADLEYDPRQIHILLQKAQEHPATAVFGSRFLQKNPNLYKHFLIGNKILTGILNMLFSGSLTDSYTCYKLLPTDLFRSLNLTAQGFELEAEIAAKCLKRNIPIHEVPISYRPRSIEEGKKIGWNDAWKGLMTMLRVWIS